jgi:SAM-dependent methyltransferase
LGKALMDYYGGGPVGELWSHSSLGTSEPVPIAHFFRDFNLMPVLEQTALKQCRGRVLDIGCGAGSHCLYLQEAGLECTGLDQSREAVEVASRRGVGNVRCENIYEFEVGNFDTLLLLMNGAGIAGTLAGLRKLLLHLGGLLAPGGQILMDSSDLIYMFEEDADGGVWVPGNVAYYGEVSYRWEYKGHKGAEFPWLFVDLRTLKQEAGMLGFEATLVQEGPHYDYLVRLSRPAYEN